MDVNDIGIFRSIARNLSWLGQRQKVLATNIANANTPDYQSVDLKPLEFKDTLDSIATVQLKATHPDHKVLPAASAEQNRRTGALAWEVAPDGNSVVLEQQMLKVAETQADYQMSTELYRKHIAMLKIAIGANHS